MNAPSPTRAGPDPAVIAGEITASRKYGAIDPDLIAAVCRSECPKETRASEAVKRVKRKLHQMVGAYVDARLPFESWLEQLRAASATDHPQICREILSHHASTRERLPEMESVYAAAFEGIPAPTRVCDLACGLNPLGRPFMPIPKNALYAAYDVHLGLVRFVADSLAVMGFPVESGTWNLLQEAPPPFADVVLILKTLPCLEQADPAASERLLRAVRAPITVVSFPTTSLSGTRRGQALFYRDRFLARVRRDTFDIEIRELRTELLFRLHRRHAH